MHLIFIKVKCIKVYAMPQRQKCATKGQQLHRTGNNVKMIIHFSIDVLQARHQHHVIYRAVRRKYIKMK